MMAQRDYPHIAVEDYLLIDEQSTHAHYEYLDGELRMLAGGSPRRAAIIANLTVAIGSFLKGSTCWLYNSDVRLQLTEATYVHPDLTVSCDQRDHESEDVIKYPLLVIEVLSPSTEAIDKIKKLAYYQECPTIQEYIMVDSQSIHLEVYHREHDGWKFRAYGPGSIVRIDSLNVSFPIDDLYQGMNLGAKRAKK